MPSFRKPTTLAIQQFLAHQRPRQLTYSEIGETFGNLPTGYKINHNRILLGQGEAVFESACGAMKRWDQFRLGWIEAGPVGTPITKGQIVAISARVAGLWWLNACRIVKTVDENGSMRRFGFAYGTLPCHVGCGEERFLIEWDQRDNCVWYDILAFSRPNFLFAKFGWPYFRHVQRQFGLTSTLAMKRIVTVAVSDDMDRKS